MPSAISVLEEFWTKPTRVYLHSDVISHVIPQSRYPNILTYAKGTNFTLFQTGARPLRVPVAMFKLLRRISEYPTKPCRAAIHCEKKLYIFKYLGIESPDFGEWIFYVDGTNQNQMIRGFNTLSELTNTLP